MTGTRWRDRLTTSGLLVCALLVTVLALLNWLGIGPHSRRDLRPQPDSPVANWDSLLQTPWRIGPQSAPVTIVEFGDFECLVCATFANHALKGVRANYPDDVAVLFHHWPLPYHRFAYPAARAAECAGAQGRFVQFYDLMYTAQDSLGLKPFAQFAADAGVSDLPAFERCNTMVGTVPRIESDKALALRTGGRGTPTIVVNGKMLGGVPDSAAFDGIIRTALNGARTHQGGRPGD
jgi:protein-disulfide isomerase